MTWTPSYRTQNPNDPARFKSGFVGQNGINPGYAGAVQQHNADLYTPMDRRPNSSPSSTPAWNRTGWNTPSWLNPSQPNNGSNPAGNPDGQQTETQQPPSIIDTAPTAQPPGASSPVAPPQNALQRWQADGASSSTQALGDRLGIRGTDYLRAFGRIDARAPQAANSYTPNPVVFPATGGHSGWNAGGVAETRPGMSPQNYNPTPFTFPATGGHSGWSPF